MNKIFYFLLCITLFNNTINADSPLTSTDFYKAYLDVPEVLEASKSDGVLSSNFFNFLNAKENKIDAKIALINALKWNLKGKKNAQVYINKLFTLNKNYTSNNFYLKASAEELICYSYIKAMDNYFDVNKALVFANKALEIKPKSLTINMIHSLIKAQTKIYNQDNWCEIYKLASSVIKNNSFNKDFRKQAIHIITKYTDCYKIYCKWNLNIMV
jgi:hypothetical protein